jgi:hypothetical protein
VISSAIWKNPSRDLTAVIHPPGGKTVWRGDHAVKRVYDAAAGKFPAFLRLHD